MDQPAIATFRAEIDDRQAAVARLLETAKAEQLLLMDPANKTWFVGNQICRGMLDPQDEACLIITPSQRWLICSNTDSQRIFDAYLDRLGFQLKEWPWHIGREQLLADLCQNRTIASDRLLRDTISVANELRALRLALSPSMQSSVIHLGRDLAHSLEATCRNIERSSTEVEIAGHLGHRLLRRGIEPVAIQVAADRRWAIDPRPSPTAQKIDKCCAVSATVRRGGVHATAARIVSFGPPANEVRADIDTVGPIASARVAHLRTGATIRDVFEGGQVVATALNAEEAWRAEPFAWQTGIQPVEVNPGPLSGQILEPGHAVVLQTRIGGIIHLETFLLRTDRVDWATRPEEWPIRRYRVGEQSIELADILVR
ncbi:MAG: hypothetical protein ACJ8C4_02420 [Gemmataceae bacterium]